MHFLQDYTRLHSQLHTVLSSCPPLFVPQNMALLASISESAKAVLDLPWVAVMLLPEVTLQLDFHIQTRRQAPLPTTRPPCEAESQQPGSACDPLSPPPVILLGQEPRQPPLPTQRLQGTADPPAGLQRRIHQVRLPRRAFAQSSQHICQLRQLLWQAGCARTHCPTSAGLAEFGKAWAAAARKAMGCTGCLMLVESNTIMEYKYIYLFHYILTLY